ncbi:hypothetical protein D9619_000387 [Psilocybe cf. subviscida]|uniref:Uncharacterized protein n=1 Tax=Psilocybe cf. subviscida TaxID=2480587 RepID=A0A8H5BEK5_9AGAR|nr:hypothetical protein D9619_000387 [Psilocybe cf. subviscida]
MESANLMFAARQRVSSESLVSSYGSCRSLLLRHILIRPRSQRSIPSIPSTTLSVPHTFPYIESLAGLLLGMKTATAGTSGAVPHRDEFGALSDPGVRVELYLSFGRQASMIGASSSAMGRRSAVRDSTWPRTAFDIMLFALLAACPCLIHLDLACMTRPTFSPGGFFRTKLRDPARDLTLIEMKKSNEDSKFMRLTSLGLRSPLH